MLKNSTFLAKAVGTALIFLTLLSTAAVVARGCHVEQAAATPIALESHHSHGDHHLPPVTEGFANSSSFEKICAGIFFLVLIFGGKFLFRVFFQRYRDRIRNFRVSLVSYKPIVSFNLTLSLPQLGICRI